MGERAAWPLPRAGEEDSGGWERGQAGAGCRNSGSAETFAPRGVSGGAGTLTLEAAGIGVGVSGKQSLSAKRHRGEESNGTVADLGPACRVMRLSGLGVGGSGGGWQGRSQPPWVEAEQSTALVGSLAGPAVGRKEVARPLGSPSPLPFPHVATSPELQVPPAAAAAAATHSTSSPAGRQGLWTGDCTSLLCQQGGPRDCAVRKFGGFGGSVCQHWPWLCVKRSWIWGICGGASQGSQQGLPGLNQGYW